MLTYYNLSVILFPTRAPVIMRFLSFSLAALVAVSMSGCSSDEKSASQTTTGQNSAKVIPSLTEAEKEAVTWLLGGPKEPEWVKPENAKKLATLAALNEEAFKKYLTDCDVKTNLVCGVHEKILSDLAITPEQWGSASLDLKKALRQDMAAFLAHALNLMARGGELQVTLSKMGAKQDALKKKFRERLAADKKKKQNHM